VLGRGRKAVQEALVVLGDREDPEAEVSELSGAEVRAGPAVKGLVRLQPRSSPEAKAEGRLVKAEASGAVGRKARRAPAVNREVAGVASQADREVLPAADEAAEVVGTSSSWYPLAHIDSC
jgi:hypothetical protein